MRDIRRQVALLSVSVAEKVIRKDLDNSQTDFVDKMVDEMSDKMDVKNN
jgi:F-type H+-transporting ATPase subunit b